MKEKTRPIWKSCQQLPKVCGADAELGNFIDGRSNRDRTCAAAAEKVRREFHGHSHDGLTLFGDAAIRPTVSLAGRFDPQDRGRKYLSSNGGCVYIDLDHVELCIPEVRSAYDFVAATHAMLRLGRSAQFAANDKLAPGETIRLLVNNSDGKGNSYGSHLNFLITGEAWNNIFVRRIHYMLYLASYQVSSIIFAGQGKVGSEHGRPSVDFQISARADFFEQLVGPQTTHSRPIINTRDEPLCNSASPPQRGQQAGLAPARLHVIFYDNNLSQVATLLKAGVMQIILAMIECEEVRSDVLLDDPLGALQTWSHDPTLRSRARMTDGRQLTAVELQLMFCEQAAAFIERGGCEGIVPRAGEILAMWRDVLATLQTAAVEEDPEALGPLAPRLDWVLKFLILRRALRQQDGLTWESPQLKVLDHIYSSVGPDGLYWAYEQSGFVDTVVTDAEIERFTHEPPDDTRAWTRAMLLRRLPNRDIVKLDWDRIEFKLHRRGGWPDHWVIELDNPLAFTREQAGPYVQSSAEMAHVAAQLGGYATTGRTLRSRTNSRWDGRAWIDNAWDPLPPVPNAILGKETKTCKVESVNDTHEKKEETNRDDS